MKHKILIALFGFLALFGFSHISFAQEIGFSYSSGDHFGKGCTVAVDLTMDTKGKNVSTTDVVLESSMKYVDFVPNKNLFPYYFPPVVRSNGLVHVVGFTVFPDQVITTSGTLGTLYFQANATDTDASIKIYFLGTGNTTDTNLSYGGVDQLQTVNQAYFVLDQSPCTHDAAVVSGGFAGISYEDSLNATVNQISDDYTSNKIRAFFANNTVLLIVSFALLILLILCVIYRKKVIAFIKNMSTGKKAIQ